MFLKKLFKGAGFTPKPERRRFVESIPKGSLSFSEILKEVSEMSGGESREFKFNPLDPILEKGTDYFATYLTFKVGKAMLYNFTVEPERGVYLVKVTLLENR